VTATLAGKPLEIAMQPQTHPGRLTLATNVSIDAGQTLEVIIGA
jgi:hypothetical protein